MVGRYSASSGVTFTVRRDGDSLLAEISAEGEQLEVALHPRSETQFVAEVDGNRLELVFTLGDDGRATEVILTQQGFSMTLPRVP